MTVYTDEQRSAALAALAANGGNILKTAREVGIPERTLGDWARRDRSDRTSNAQRSTPNAEVGSSTLDVGSSTFDSSASVDALAELQSAARQIFRRLQDRQLLQKAPLSQVAITAGIVLDKIRTLEAAGAAAAGSAEPEDLAEYLTDEEARQLEEIYERARSRRAKAEGSPPADPSLHPVHVPELPDGSAAPAAVAQT